MFGWSCLLSIIRNLDSERTRGVCDCRSSNLALEAEVTHFFAVNSRGARLAPFLALVALFTAACAEVAPTNPFDPSTPAGQQAKATVHGFVALPPGYPPERFGGAGIDLVGLGDASTSGQMGTLAPGPVVAGEVSSDPAAFPYPRSPASARRWQRPHRPAGRSGRGWRRRR